MRQGYAYNWAQLWICNWAGRATPHEHATAAKFFLHAMVPNTHCIMVCNQTSKPKEYCQIYHLSYKYVSCFNTWNKHKQKLTSWIFLHMRVTIYIDEMIWSKRNVFCSLSLYIYILALLSSDFGGVTII